MPYSTICAFVNYGKKSFKSQTHLFVERLVSQLKNEGDWGVLMKLGKVKKVVVFDSSESNLEALAGFKTSKSNN